MVVNYIVGCKLYWNYNIEEYIVEQEIIMVVN